MRSQAKINSFGEINKKVDTNLRAWPFIQCQSHSQCQCMDTFQLISFHLVKLRMSKKLTAPRYVKYFSRNVEIKTENLGGSSGNLCEKISLTR